MESEEIFGYVWRFPKNWDYVNIYPLGDLHCGNPAFSEKYLDYELKIITDDPFGRILFMGDLCETVLKDSKGDVYGQVIPPAQQKKWIVNKFKPFRDILLGATSGNHEDRIRRATGDDYTQQIAEELEIPYRYEGLWLRLCIGGGNGRHADRPYVYHTYATHGFGSAATTGARMAKLERVSHNVSADVYFMGHDHHSTVDEIVRIDPCDQTYEEGGFEKFHGISHHCHLIKTNSFLRWCAHGEKAGFSPSSMRVPKVTLWADDRPIYRRIDVLK